jgi:hypothetical protein
MSVERNEPLPANTRVHPEPHVPYRGRIILSHPLDELSKVTRQEGDYRVTYHSPFFLRMEGGRAVYSLAAPVMATWERIKGSPHAR